MCKEKSAEDKDQAKPATRTAMNWRPTQKEIEERMVGDPDYTPNHDGRLWMIV